MTLKKQLAFYLEHSGMTAAQLAKKTGVSKQVISLWLSGGAPRKLDQVRAVANLLSTSIDNLCYGEGIKGESGSSEPNITDEWLSGTFEVKVRRVK